MFSACDFENNLELAGIANLNVLTCSGNDCIMKDGTTMTINADACGENGAVNVPLMLNDELTAVPTNPVKLTCNNGKLTDDLTNIVNINVVGCPPCKFVVNEVARRGTGGPANPGYSHQTPC